MIKNLLLAGLWLIFSGLPGLSQTFQSTPYAVGTPLANNTLLYGLPRTSLKVDVELVKTVIRKGPFAEYAAKYLQMNVNKADIVKWRIATVSLSEHFEMDPSQYYVITFKNLPKNIERLITLTKEGALLDMSLSSFLASGEFAPAEITTGFRNMVIENPLFQTVDTLYQLMLKDSAFVKEPLVVKKLQHLPKELQAKELAQQIFDLRQRRQDLLTGEADDSPDAPTLKMLLEQIELQEASLLTLFTGTSMEIPAKRSFVSLPSESSRKTTLFYFSDQTGFAPNKEGAMEVACHFTPQGEVTVNNMELVHPKTVAKSKKEKEILKNSVYYRVPAQVDVKISINNEALASKRIPVYQMGTLTSILLEVK
ncbi:MAG: DUF4831 family protein [Bacteroidales bacterium]